MTTAAIKKLYSPCLGLRIQLRDYYAIAFCNLGDEVYSGPFISCVFVAYCLLHTNKDVSLEKFHAYGY